MRYWSLSILLICYELLTRATSEGSVRGGALVDAAGQGVQISVSNPRVPRWGSHDRAQHTSVPTTVGQDAPRVLRTVAVGASPFAVAVDTRLDRAFTADLGGHDISVVDLHKRVVVRTIPIGGSPVAVAIDVRHARVIAVTLTGVAVVINARTLTVVRRIVLSEEIHRPSISSLLLLGNAAHLVAVDERMGHTFVAWPPAVVTLDTMTGRTVHSVVLSSVYPYSLVVDEATHHVYAAGINGTMNGACGVCILDSRTGSQIGSVAIYGGPRGMVVDDRTSRLFIANADVMANWVSVFDTRSGRLVARPMTGEAHEEVAVDTRAGRAFVPNEQSNNVSVLDARTGAVLTTVATGQYSADVAVDEGAGRAVVTNSLSGSVSVLDTRANRVVATLPVGAGPNAVAIDGTTHVAIVLNQHSDTATLISLAPI